MGFRSQSIAACGAVIAGLLAGAPPSSAAGPSYGAYVGMGYTDNVARVPVGEQDESIASIGGQFSLDHESRRVDANIATRLEYREYLDNTFDSEVAGNFIGKVKFDFVEERISWTIEDTFGQTTMDQFGPSTPANRESVNYLSTGPDFTVPLGGRNALELRGRYVDVHYEDSNLGNQRIRGDLAFRRDISDASNLSLNFNTEQVTFDDETQFTDFDHDEAFLSYALNAARTTLSIDGGITEVTSNDQTSDSWLGRLELTRQISPSLNIGIKFGHDLSDAASAFANLQASQPGSLDPVQVQQTAMPFENNYGVVYGRFTRNRTGMQLRVAYYDERYEEQSQFDRERLQFDLSLQRDLNSAISARFSANYSHQEYKELFSEFTDLTATLGLRWNLGRASYASLDYQYLDRDDEDNATDYNASEVWLRLAYIVGEDIADGSYSGF